MVERTNTLDAVFRSLSDPTRRDILRRVGRESRSIGELARHYDLSFAGVAKHVDVLSRAGLVTKERQGKEQIVTLAPRSLADASAYLEPYRKLWEGRLRSLDAYLEAITRTKKTN
jgi:DNA-binding transcriptional ArsR family regulator